MRWAIAAGVWVLVLLVSACGGRHRPTLEPIRVRTEAPIESRTQAPGFQQRSLPWETLSLRSSQRYRLLPQEEDENALPVGLHAGRARLRAGEAARRDIATRLAALPAAEPAPGETEARSLQTFSQRHQAIADAVKQALVTGCEESVSIGADGTAVLSVELTLSSLAQTVLDHGGGFSPEHRIGRELGAEAQARNQAFASARRELREKVGGILILEDVTIGDWAALNALNEERLMTHLRTGRVIMSEAEHRPGGERVWIAEVEYDPEPFRAELEDELRTILARRQ